MAPPNGKGTLISGSRTMRIINHSFAVDRYFDLISTATSRVLIIDYGGLAPPSDHGPCLPIPAVPGLLEQIRSRTGTRLVLISDRDCKTVRSLLGLHPPPEIWGVGGLERAWPDGSYELAPFDERALRGLAEADDWSQAAGLLPWTEQKPGGIALLERTSEATDWNSLRARPGLRGPRSPPNTVSAFSTLNTGSNCGYLRGPVSRRSKPFSPKQTPQFPSPISATESSASLPSMP